MLVKDEPYMPIAGLPEFLVNETMSSVTDDGDATTPELLMSTTMALEFSSN
jgi:hypothetical protein